MAAQISGASMAKLLASCNQTARSRAVRLLTRWLPQQSPAADALSDGDLAKIWKGLFYCVWHADKPAFQVDLINRLSGLLETLDPDLAVRYLESFLVTVRREWSGIDFLRLDKFYLMIRKFVHSLFALLKKNSWDVDLLNRLVNILMEKSLLSTDKFQAAGVNYHIAEVFLDEIQGFLPVEKETLMLLLRPFVCALEKSNDRILVVKKIKVNVFERLLEHGSAYLIGEREGAEKLGKYPLVLGLSKVFFTSASEEGTVQGNRKVLFELHEKFLKLEKDLEKSGLEISFHHVSEVVKDESLSGEVVDKARRVDGKPLKKKRKKEKDSSDSMGKKTKANVTQDSAVDGNGNVDVSANGVTEDSAVNSNGNVVVSATGVNDMESIGEETLSGSSKKKKKKKNKSLPDSVQSSRDLGGGTINENGSGNVRNGELLNFDETVISNLQKQFEKIAAEAGLPGTPPANITVSKKRKCSNTADKPVKVCNGESLTGKSEEKSVKKVRFAMKNNLVWKPQTPLPPQSLRLPPSATPRGSALKKGVSPGPVKPSPPTVKRIKAKGSSVKKARKSLKSVSPAVKQLRKLHSLSV